MSVVKPLYDHVSEDTAYVVNDYPYGSLRCQIRFWLEKHPKRGWRMVSRTQNPKTMRWNAEKKSTYYEFAASLYLDEKEHCVWTAIGEYSEAKEILEFIKSFPESDFSRLHPWVILKVAMYRKLVSGEAYFTYNGVKQERSDEDKERDQKSLAAWEECMTLLRKEVSA